MTQPQPDNIIRDITILSLLGLWFCVSAMVLSRLGFFNGKSLRIAQPRSSRLDPSHPLLILLMYVSLNLSFGILLKSSNLAPSGDKSTPAGSNLFQIIDLGCRFAVLLGMLYLSHNLVKGRLPAFGLDPQKIIRGIFQGISALLLLVPWLLLSMAVTAYVSEHLRTGVKPIHPLLEEMNHNPSLITQMIVIFSAVVAAPIVEEVFFRGLVQTTLLRMGISFGLKTKAIGKSAINGSFSESMVVPDAVPSVLCRWLTILIASAIFALVHGLDGNWEAVSVIFVLALALGYLYEVTGNLWACMVLHATFNGVNLWLNAR